MGLGEDKGYHRRRGALKLPQPLFLCARLAFVVDTDAARS